MSTDMDFEHLDLVPMANADEILDRWTRPYLNMSTASVPKAFPPYTIQYITRILKSYVSKLNSSAVPPFIHHQQVTGNVPPILANCFSLVRSWLNRMPGNEKIIQRQILREMRKIYDQGPQSCEIDRLCAFQAYLIYMMAIFSSSFEEGALEDDTELESHIRLQGIGFYCAKTGITSEAEELNNRPKWESYIITSAKRRTLFTMYLLSSVYNFKMGLPNFVAEELRGAFLPDGSRLWGQHNRAAWEQAYHAHLSRWPDGKLEISELWRDSETGSAARQERIERWLEFADEFGTALFAVCAHIHGC
ncbi:hypothetical protein N7460_013128 [Penicillium canescens]|uniref:Transcription factor domain-containing protein n=2 Tax=Penicillium canescens TaxID=5083 RepID=A0AAD6N1V5_PENCN|nr:hypothetical protein N7460_013128 [Penicillium canescens]